MNILGLDLAQTMGFCQGDSDAPPRATESGSILVVQADEHITQANVNLACWLRDRIRANRPALIAVEQWLDPSQQHSSSEVLSSLLLHGAVISVAGMAKIPLARVTVQTWRYHFCGRASYNPRSKVKLTDKQKRENRKQNKLMVRDRAALLGYFPKTCWDYDRGDACGVYDWAVAKYARANPLELHLFGEAAQ